MMIMDEASNFRKGLRNWLHHTDATNVCRNRDALLLTEDNGFASNRSSSSSSSSSDEPLLHDTADSFILNRTLLGCVPSTYLLSAPLLDPQSLWRLYMRTMIPNYLFRYNASKVFVQSSKALKHSLCQGPVYLQDIYAICPKNESIYRIVDSIRGDVLMHSFFLNPRTTADHTDDVNVDAPQFVLSKAGFSPTQYYALYAPMSDLHQVLARLPRQQPYYYYYRPKPSCHHHSTHICDYTATVWRDYVETTWTCPTNSAPTAAATHWLRLHRDDDDDNPVWMVMMMMILICLVAATLLGSWLSVQRRRRVSNSTNRHTQVHTRVTPSSSSAAATDEEEELQALQPTASTTSSIQQQQRTYGSVES